MSKASKEGMQPTVENDNQKDIPAFPKTPDLTLAGLLTDKKSHQKIQDLIIKFNEKKPNPGIFKVNPTGPFGKTYIIADEGLITEALAKLERHPMIHGALKPMLGEQGLFVVENGEEHAALKKNVFEFFKKSAVEQEYMQPMWNFISEQVGSWLKLNKGKKAAETKDLGVVLAVGSMLNSLIPLDIEVEDMPDWAYYFNQGEVFTAIKPKVSFIPLVDKLLYKGGQAAFLADQLKYEQVMIDALVSALDETTQTSGYLKKMAQQISPEVLAEKSPEEQQATKAEIAKQVMSILIAGEVTTRAAIQSMFVFLASNPQHWQELLSEVSRVYPNLDEIDLNHDNLRRLPIIRKIVGYIAEQAPPLTIIRGTGKGGVQVGSHHIDPDSMVLISPYAFNHKKGQAFNPYKDYNPFAMFGEGQRVCIGGQVAEGELELILLAVAVEALKQNVTLTMKNPDPTLDNLESGFAALHPVNSEVEVRDMV